jgi:uncharacterized repeat protein (TIGR01451 family)
LRKRVLALKSFRPNPRSVRRRRAFAFSSHSIIVPALVLAVAALVSSLSLYVSAQNEAAGLTIKGSQNSKVESVAGELLVRFRSNSSLAPKKDKKSANFSLAAAGRNVPLQIERFAGSDLVEGLMLVRVAPEDSSLAIKVLRSRDDVLYAEPNYVRHTNAVPNDPRYADLWAMKNAPAGGAGISAEAAWDVTTGSHSVVVGVVDTGIDIGHRDLANNIFVNPGEIPNNGVDDDGNGFVDDINGWDFVNNDKTVFDSASNDAHGTHVAGTIGARGNNSVGVAGVNWDVQIMPLKVFSPFGADSNLIAAFQYAKMMKQRGVNLRVLNNSYGGQGFSQSLHDAISELNTAGILFVAAAGNATTINDFVPEYPASYELPNVISVAASDSSGGFASQFSNRGQQSVHLAAPGQGILSTTPRGYTGDGLVAAYTEPDGSTYSNFSGTSMASPHVAGAAALACAANPNLTLQQLRAAVLFSGDESGAFLSLTITGRRLNANKAVQAALENDTTAPAIPANFRVNSQSDRRVGLRWNEAGDDGTSSRASLDEITFTDAGSGEKFKLNSTRTLDPGTERTVFVSIPFKHTAGQLSLRTFDNVGNSSMATTAVTVAADVADPYTVTINAPAALTPQNSGTRLGLRGDDTIVEFHDLPFFFPFFGFGVKNVAVSSNGAIYIQIPPDFAVPRPNVGGDDAAAANTANLDHLAMIAGMWSDLRTDRRASDDVYVVQPDRDRVIFRWQAVEYGSETPANFEIELRRDGTIQTRYGDGNQALAPVVVGISGGDPASYVVPTHTSEASPLSLTNAQSVTFALRNPPPPPTSDLAVRATANPDPVLSGQNMMFQISVSNLGPSIAEDLVMTDVLPAGTTFVSCTSNYIAATCTGPAVGTNGTVTGKTATVDALPGGSAISFNIVANVTAAPGALLQNNASATSYRTDPNPSNNSASSSSTVVAESFFSAVKAIAAGRMHTASVRNDGTVWNWGTGSNGQLGDGNSGVGVAVATPVQVAGLEGFVSVADGSGFVIALKSDGTVWGWGLNNSGQLGDGTTTDRTTPVPTIGLTDVTAISTYGFFSFALRSDGTVWTWGYGGGIGSTVGVIRTTPVQLTGISNVTKIAAGGGHALMLKSDKTVWAVGGNSRGQLGDGTTTDRPFPVPVTGLSNAAAIAAGGDEFSLALKEDGTVWAWGINFTGELGPGGGPTNFDPHPTPLQVTGLPAGVTTIATGRDFCLALAGNGTVWGWGNDSDFQAGQGTGVINNPTPKQILNFTGVLALAAGLNHSVALKTDGSVWTWGGNNEGQLGDGTTTSRSTPRQVSGLQTVSAPSFSPPSGGYTTAIDVTITSATPGATIHYTTNGQPPTENDPVFAAGSTIHLTGFTFVFARAWKAGWIPSSTSYGRYDINIPPNQIDTSQFFVRQHYLDFLGRQPDDSGLNFWTNNIESCNSNAQCREVKRIDTSAAFFLSIEFQETGYLVHRSYKVAFGNLPGKPVPLTRQQFLPDLQQIGQGVVVGQGDWQAQLETNKRNYLDQFVQHSAFVALYPTTLAPAQFVDALNANTDGALTTGERDGLVAGLINGTKTRAQVLRAIAENAEVNRRESNRAFVLMQYFGYLGRNPNDPPETGLDFAGYNFWLSKLNQFNGDFRKAEMVKAFIVSGEYRHRFGP